MGFKFKKRFAFLSIALLAALFLAFFNQPTALPILSHIRPAKMGTTTPQRYILTGGPCVGKTSILHYLRDNGYPVVEEAATEVIRRSLANGIEKPWDKNYKSDFNDEILDVQHAKNQELTASGPIFFDRSMIDTFSYALIPMGGTKSLKTMAQKLQSALDNQFYHTTVFFIDNLSNCEQTEIRHENLEQLLMIEKHLEQNYRALGYNIIHIGKDTIENRAKQILDHIELSR